MPVPEDVIRCNLNFSLGSEEIAVSGFHMKLDHIPGANTNWPEMVTTAAQKIYEKFKAAFDVQAASQSFPPTVKLRDVTVYHLEAATGHALDRGQHVPAAANVWSGGSGISLPLECSLAVSLYGYAQGEFVPQRARKRGRMYLPPLNAGAMSGASFQSAGRVATAQHTGVALAVGTFFNDVHRMTVGQDPLDVGQNWDLVVLSKAAVATTVVKQVRVGDVMDVQRRRRNNQVETYLSTPITP